MSGVFQGGRSWTCCDNHHLHEGPCSSGEAERGEGGAWGGGAHEVMNNASRRRSQDLGIWENLKNQEKPGAEALRSWWNLKEPGETLKNLEEPSRTFRNQKRHS